jgi:hypothetical protein
MSTSLHLSAVKILRTGGDGGHLYIRGRAELPSQGECDVYAYFRSKEEERAFESQFAGQPVLLEADGVEFTRGIGASVREIVSWKLTWTRLTRFWTEERRADYHLLRMVLCAAVGYFGVRQVEGGMPGPPQAKYVGRFLIVGILLTYGLMFLMTAKGPFAGAGDGAGHYDRPPAAGIALPYAAYFFCGVVAAASAKQSIRISAAIIAHLAPFVSLVFADAESRTFFILLAFIIYAVFGAAWFRMLKCYDQSA